MSQNLEDEDYRQGQIDAAQDAFILQKKVSQSFKPKFTQKIEIFKLINAILLDDDQQ